MWKHREEKKMLIRINGLMNRDQIMADLKTRAKTCMTSQEYDKCRDIVLQTVKRFVLLTTRVPSYAGTLTFFACAKRLPGYP